MKIRLDEKEPFLCDCRSCKGTGKIPHECGGGDTREVENLYGSGRSHGESMESLGIYVCLVCGQLWKIRYQYDPGTGSDDIWIKPGEEDGIYKFPVSEAKKYVKAAERVLDKAR